MTEEEELAAEGDPMMIEAVKQRGLIPCETREIDDSAHHNLMAFGVYLYTVCQSQIQGVKQDGSVSHFFHRTFKAYNTRTRKRRKINTGDLADVRWHKTGKTKPVIVDGQHLGCKKIMVLYMSTVKGGKPKKTNWVMHQYHLGTGEDEQNGEYVVSKLFFQQQSKPGEKSALELFVPKK
ncbi:hypothetical protein ZWY2020_035542 [Hordeum vulgare]|nr:hypothetical protein ZWY2020_035542 [Hordeum vulgare]